MESKTTTEEVSIPTPDDHDDSSATIIHNASQHTMIVFQERAPTGTYSNIQVLQPGEAVIMTRQLSAASTGALGGGIAGGIGNVASRVLSIGAPPPSKFHAIVGDESCLSSLADESTKNLLKNAAIPAAFIVGCLVTAISAGTLAGPSIALAPLVSGVVINGLVVDTAAVAAGTVLATRARAVTELLNKDKPTEYAAKTKGMRQLKRGKGRYLVVSGGLSDGAVTISEIGSKENFEKKYRVSVWKRPLENCRCSATGGGGSGKRNKIWRIGSNNKSNNIVVSAVAEEG